ncbi:MULTISPECIES: DUF1254 domain-containing protein [Rhodococcus]|uniref:DUF1254 domain-containing protein n=1 Tax=Rhodococcus wratislaviensis NBRC 100605 TaxID=1219028 RepID=X0PYV3_RHOWR|nr:MULTISPECIES: DUF1254 domain-containing protein [Rhodococcus]WAM14665.1 DUF1254 domain-containing protein [Rhodococcus sp. JS3073]GAF42926.1 hypothetical protein RW1_005_00300 [Rhodococcus wratislaviensis NBRC 100605]
MTTSLTRPSSPGSIERIGQKVGTAASVAVEAYLWGYPLVLMNRTKRLLTCRDHRGAAPINTLRHRTALATARDREIVKPNNDTIYSIGWLDLAAGPLVLDVPEVHGRYYSFQFLDAYTNTWEYVGRRTTGTHPGRFVLVGPTWRGDLPDGKVLTSPTNTVWLIGRTIVDSPEDLAEVAQLVEGYRLSPAVDGDREPRWTTGPIESPHTIGEAGIEFFDELCAAMETDPAPTGEEDTLARFATLGIAPGLRPSTDITDPVARTALEHAVTIGDRLLAARRTKSERAWDYNLELGTYGTNHLLRAAVARHGLGALTASEAIYATTEIDATGRQLTGAHDYRLHFDSAHLPPVDAFWSLTMYDDESFLVHNPADRYAIGDRTTGLTYGPDGSLEIIIQHRQPTDATERANWLPAPGGNFQLTMRFYEPREEMLTNRYVIPAVTRR